jgi:3-methylcrotonyl-CoA carboxylase alpha subunit
VIDAPMTGTVLDVPVNVGDAVTADATVVVLNAMKMEHKLRAGVAGVVKEVSCKAGEIVDQGRVLVRVEAS